MKFTSIEGATGFEAVARAENSFSLAAESYRWRRRGPATRSNCLETYWVNPILPVPAILALTDEGRIL